MKAVVTGGCGFIGSHLVDLLLENNIQTVVLDNMSTGRPENLAHCKDNPLLSIHEVDISTSDNLSFYLKDTDYIFHLAALADIVPSVERPHDYYQANVTGTFNLLESARHVASLKKIVYSASSSCYGIPEKYPTNEESEIKPQYPYALTKRLGEELLMHWGHVYHLPVLSFRFFNVYGPRSRTSGTYGAVFGTFLAQKLAGEAFTIVGNGEQTRDFTYVKDVADALFTGAKSNLEQEIMNIGSSQTYSVNKLVTLLSGGTFPKDKVSYIPKRPGEPDITFADISKIKKLLNWSPKTSFEEGVRIMLEHINYWKDAPVWTPEAIATATKPWFDALNK